MDREFELEQLYLAIDYYEKQLENSWFTSNATACQNNIQRFRNRYNELRIWKTLDKNMSSLLR